MGLLCPALPRGDGVIDRGDMEETLRLIPGVLSARIVGDAGDPVEVHVLAESGRHPKQVARDVESCLAAKFGLSIDHRRISVAQIESAPKSAMRLTLEEVAMRFRGNVAAAEVVLRLDGQRYVGRAEGTASARRRLILAAKAAVDGVTQAVGPRVDIVVEDVGRFVVSQRSVIACVVTLADARGEHTLVGSAIVRRDECEAAVRAVLAGLNRMLGLLLDEERLPA